MATIELLAEAAVHGAAAAAAPTRVGAPKSAPAPLPQPSPKARGSAAAAPAARRFGVLRHRDSTLLRMGLLVSDSGTWMQGVAQGWVTYSLTDSVQTLGATALAFGVPMVTFPPFGGVVADRVLLGRLDLGLSADG